MLKPSRNVQMNNRCKIVDLRHSIVSVALEFASFTQTCIERVLSREASRTTLEGRCFAMRNTGNLVSRAKSEREPSVENAITVKEKAFFGYLKRDPSCSSTAATTDNRGQ